MSGRFLERWSRLKKAAEKVEAAEITDAESLLANLTPDSDFGQFLRQEISEEVRRKAMKTLFADPQFNVMDGLDTYIDDYSISEPIPEAMMATLNHARGLLSDAPAEEATAPEKPENCDILAGDGQNVPVAAPAAIPPLEKP
ncbi:MAG TPA: DUF3306 domain-containing protein [Azonexus sp.]|nr:DUF3306 domain-containing protein [Azonexus sp.]